MDFNLGPLSGLSPNNSGWVIGRSSVENVRVQEVVNQVKFIAAESDLGRLHVRRYNVYYRGWTIVLIWQRAIDRPC